MAFSSYIYILVFLQHFAPLRRASTPLPREVEGTDTDLVSYLLILSFPGLAKHMAAVWSFVANHIRCTVS